MQKISKRLSIHARDLADGRHQGAWVTVIRTGSSDYGWESRMRTTSDSVWPRMRPSLRPSRDQLKSLISSDLKSVICLPGEPSRGCSQRLAVPPLRTG